MRGDLGKSTRPGSRKRAVHLEETRRLRRGMDGSRGVCLPESGRERFAHVGSAQTLNLVIQKAATYPVGMEFFFTPAADLNTPSSMIHNKHAQQQYQLLKSGSFEEEEGKREEEGEDEEDARRL